jgi:perosamine synthetase
MWEVVKQFEKAMCEYTGAPHAVAVESCSAALFLSCLRANVKSYSEIDLPKITYPSVPAAVINAGGRVRFVDLHWQNHGWYAMTGRTYKAIGMKETYFLVIDSAKYIERDMYDRLGGEGFICLSFHHKKALPIGRGGMILCESKEDDEWFRWMKHDGRSEGVGLTEDTLHCVGWNMSFTPEQAARGLTLLSVLPDRVVLPPEPYQDLSKYKFFTEANR